MKPLKVPSGKQTSSGKGKTYMNNSTYAQENQPKPPSYIMGVENQQTCEHDATSWHIDYLRVTVWPEPGIDAVMLLNSAVGSMLGAFVASDRGRYGYTRSLKALANMQVYYMPTDEVNRFTIELPGQACQLIGFDRLAALYQSIARNSIRFQVTRIDVAFDNVPFTPSMLFDAVETDKVRSYFKRDTLKFYNQPHQIDEAGRVGTTGCTFGGRSSTRYLRCYDQHGFDRLEIEFKAEKADQVACDILLEPSDTAVIQAMGHLLDYVDIDADWWRSFKDEYMRLYKKIENTADMIEVNKITRWLVRQASGAIAALVMMGMEGITDVLVREGHARAMKSPRYGALLYPSGSVVTL